MFPVIETLIHLVISSGQNPLTATLTLLFFELALVYFVSGKCDSFPSSAFDLSAFVPCDVFRIIDVIVIGIVFHWFSHEGESDLDFFPDSPISEALG